jgi:hypothetical protein
VRYGSVLSCLGGAGAHGDDGFTRGEAAGEPAELVRVAERFQVQHGKLGALLAQPPAEHVVAAEVVPVAQRHQGRDPQIQVAELVEQRNSRPAGLGGHPHRPRGRGQVGERRIQPHLGIGVDQAEAVRVDQPHPVLAHRLEQRAVQRLVTGNPGGDHQQSPHPLAPALLRDIRHVWRGHAHHRQIRGLGKGCHARVARYPGDLPGVRVDREQPPGEPTLADPAQDRVPDRALAPAGPDDRDHVRRQHRPQAGRVGLPLPFGDRVQVPFAQLQRHPQVQHRAVVGHRHGQPTVHEDVQHPAVFRQYLGHEAPHPAITGQGHQMLQ